MSDFENYRNATKAEVARLEAERDAAEIEKAHWRKSFEAEQKACRALRAERDEAKQLADQRLVSRLVAEQATRLSEQDLEAARAETRRLWAAINRTVAKRPTYDSTFLHELNVELVKGK